ncbi:arsenate reductase family protein [Paenimyroides viscosum]|uniref:Arsenate reductase n=1 Tax=Paenimyroides viscosum TaxID=2488729 RepID=A0A3P1B0T3_9FLAO|nr:ArsC/Spx/MgsR family protein [Paenimyroides viscosum]RRA94700.1 arsenate reductase [Paenimyroides viscosum]
MKKIYYLKTCDTCKRILKQIKNLDQFELQEIKTNPITEKQLEEMYALTNSYETLFNKRAQLYKELGLKDKNLTEADYKKYLLEHYTFLARPVIIFNDQIFVGNSAKTIEAMLQKVNN